MSLLKRWSTGNYARDWNLNMVWNNICTNKNRYNIMWRVKISGILRYKRSPNPCGYTKPNIIWWEQKLSSSWYCYSRWPRVKNKNDRRTIYKCMNFVRKLNKLWNMKVMKVAIVVVALGTFPKDLGKGLRWLEIKGRIKTTKITAMLKQLEFLEESSKSKETCCHSRICENISIASNVTRRKKILL